MSRSTAARDPLARIAGKPLQVLRGRVGAVRGGEEVRLHGIVAALTATLLPPKDGFEPGPRDS